MHPVKQVDQQSLSDLEFEAIKLFVHDYCHSDSAQLLAVDLAPYTNFTLLKTDLQRVHEFLRIKTEGYSFPRLVFEELSREIDVLEV